MRQRVHDLTADESRRTRYFVMPGKDGGWQLKPDRATRATKHFVSKREAVQFSRRFVRDKHPSELVVCRADGSFQTVHRYDG